ncbi:MULTISPECIES: DUF4738 domain-containing protein [Bacteroidaceae]|uniref:DUF4738 domain-containing protein n=1 Tax=Bacteroidaceae TaxID=815 RepID=UPI000B373002|nr:MULTISPECIES: DUF4738 domain-containing protein [Bacteroidaceae]MDM8305920.1 DUF4738 domain-containing protein [Phocaeicola salanitronis]OUO23811.1 DUF4738 domain-containing protein [Bacteroides sp. An322]HJC99057.1 DUF4738 domain-containing protein [Candidatus Phocaeicola merdavium]
MRKVLSVTLFVFLIAACTGSVEKKEEKAEDERNQLIMQYLQGIWVDDNTGLPMLKIKNDSIFLASQVNAPFCFSISGDTLQAKSSEQTTYRIVKIEEHVFQFYTSLGDLVSLHKSDTDTIPFGYQPVAKPEKKVIEKDSVFYFQGKRYRGYAYINPSTKKVFRPTVTEEGMIVDNVYYDNIIHICVYQGKQCLYAKDIEKEMFAATVPDDFLQMSILSDMSFIGVDSDGYHYQATISMPDDLSCYYVNLLIDEEGVLTFKLKE